MEIYDDDLKKFEARGAEPPPDTTEQGYVENEGACIWYAAYGSGSPVILLHGGLGHGGNWGYQVWPLVEGGYRVILIDSRGHGRSTRDARPFSYELMASDVLAVMDACHLETSVLVGWSDGACIALVLASIAPARVAGIFFFACNMDPSGVKPFEATPRLKRCFARHSKDYKQMSATPGRFEEFVAAVSLMQRTQPDYSVEDLARIDSHVVIVQGENEEFIRREHAEFLAETIPNADFILLKAVGHFAPLQRPAQFNNAVLTFLARVFPFHAQDKGGAVKGTGSRTITIAVLLSGMLVVPVTQVHALTSKEPYAVMAPLDQYLMADRNAEIRLARSAAPPAISEAAKVLVLGLHGYETAAKGANGFVCVVERSWTGSFGDPEFWNPKIRSPICFNPAAARSVLPWTYKKTEMVLAGFSRAQISAGIERALNKKEIPAVEVGSMSYMMSRLSYLGDSIGHGPAHLMFFGPNKPDGAGWGENLPGSPIFRFGKARDSFEPVRTYIIPTSKWSDGEPVLAREHKH